MFPLRRSFFFFCPIFPSFFFDLSFLFCKTFPLYGPEIGFATPAWLSEFFLSPLPITFLFGILPVFYLPTCPVFHSFSTLFFSGSLRFGVRPFFRRYTTGFQLIFPPHRPFSLLPLEDNQCTMATAPPMIQG